MNMKIEILFNELCKEWWFDFGVSFQRTKQHPTKDYVFTLSIIFFSIYIRF